MTTEFAQSIIDKTNFATEFALRQREVGEPIRNNVAELVLRNASVLADRLAPAQIKELSETSRDALEQAGEAARQVAPLPSEDSKRHDYEGDLAYRHRIDISGPLHRLQALVKEGAYDEASPGKTSAVKKAIWLANTAFTEILQDPATQGFPNVNRELLFFSNNAKPAIELAQQAQAEQSAQEQ